LANSLSFIHFFAKFGEFLTKLLFASIGELIDKFPITRHIWRVMVSPTKLTDEAFLKSFGERLAIARLDHEWSQEKLARQAGVTKRRVERLEAGEVTANLAGFVRILRALGLLERLDLLLPDATPGPMEQLRAQGKRRRRASAKKNTDAKPSDWKWGDEA
jgi:transcriptional regulator with XRE-family HTH domain